MLRTAMAIAGCLLLTCGAVDGADPVSGSLASSSLTLKLHARSAAKVSVCHRAGARWVPLRLPEAAVMRHVGNHGDFVYDASAGQCCTDADCGTGLSCTLSVGLDGESLIGMCPRAGGGDMTDDPRGLLLAVGLFGPYSGAAFPFTGVLSRDATDQYSLSFTLNGIDAQVALAHFVPSGATLAENSSTPVTVTFPARNSGLITFNDDYGRSYLNLSVTASSLSGAGNVELDNATVANFNLDITGPDSYPIVSLDSGGLWAILGIRGVYVQPTSYIGDGNGSAGFYMGLSNGAMLVHVLVFREAVYDVRL